MTFSVAGMSTWSQGKETAAEIVDEQSGEVFIGFHGFSSFYGILWWLPGRFRQGVA